MTNRSGMTNPVKSICTSTSRRAGRSSSAARRSDAGPSLRSRFRDGVDGAARVDDVLDQQHVAADQWPFDHVSEPQPPMLEVPDAIARRAHELELGGDGQAAQQVGGEDRGALEDDDHHQRRVDVGVGLGDLLARAGGPASAMRAAEIIGLALPPHSKSEASSVTTSGMRVTA